MGKNINSALRSSDGCRQELPTVKEHVDLELFVDDRNALVPS